MNQIHSLPPTCGRIERYLDYYMDSELTVESSDEVLRHLESCEHCSQEIEERLRVRRNLQRAVATIQAPAALETRVRASLRTQRRNSSAFWRLPLAVAAGLVITIGGATGYHEWAGARRVTASILQIGLGDHVHCSGKGNLQSEAPPDPSLAQQLSVYKELLPIVKAKLADYKFVEAHICHFKGRAFVHFVMRGGGEPVSVILTRKRGETFPASWNPLRGDSISGLSIAGFETRSHLVFLCSGLNESRNTQLASSLMPAVKDAIASL
jgi:hypothetical protein